MTLSPDRAVEILRATPATLRALLASLSSEWIESRDGAEGWTPFDVVGHLIHGEETDWIPRLKIMLEHGEARTFDSFDRYAMFEKSAGKTLEELLDRFERLRAQNLDTLRSLKLQPEQLAIKGTHPELGSVTVGQLLATWAVHDLSHLAQIARTLARSCSREVGPWKEFLPILTR
jgi:uncharacterized damage-inducible protein DinB